MFAKQFLRRSNGETKKPFGEINISIDGKSIDYVAQKGQTDSSMWPDVKERYQIVVEYIPDGKEHNISCTFTPICPYESDYEGTEYLECKGFYNSKREKMSIGVKGERALFWDGSLVLSNGFDYDAGCIENGVECNILPETKTEEYFFGIAWIDDVGYNDPQGYRNNRDGQVWDAASPIYRL